MSPGVDRIADSAVIAALPEPLFVVDTGAAIVYTNDRLHDLTADQSLEGAPFGQFGKYVTDGFDTLQVEIANTLDGDTAESRVMLSMSPPDESAAQARLTEALVTTLSDDTECLGALVVLREVADDADADERSQNSEQRFRTMFESHSAPMLLIEPESGAITNANAAAAEFYGYSRSALTDMTIQEINCLTPAEVARERKRAERENRNHFIFEHQLAAGAVRTVEVHSTPVEVNGEVLLFSIVHDITEREESKHELQLFRAALSQTGHAVLITDEEGTIEYVNPAFESDTGYTRAEAVGQTPSLLNSGKQDDSFYADLWETITANDIWEAELVNRRKSGELYYVEQTIAPITDDDGEIANFVAVQLDITDRKLREKQLSDMNRILRHNLRNALTAIKGTAESLVSAVDPVHRPQIERILDQAETLTETSEKITAMRRSLDREYNADTSCNLGAVLSKLESTVQETYPYASITIETASVNLSLDPGTCRTIITELVDNAVRHNDRETPQVTVSVTVPDDLSQHIRLRVADNGPGIPADERTAIEIGTADPLTHSSGVGLVHVHWHVINSGGDMTITENEPRGSVVTLSLPRDR